MANQAYDLERFAVRTEVPVKKKEVNVRVVKGNKKRKNTQLRMIGMLLGVFVVIGLACGVLYTESRLAELKNGISKQERLLTDEISTYVYLTYEQDNKTNLKNVEQRALELGMRQIDKNQISYVQTAEDNQIEVYPSGVAKLFENTKAGALSIADYAGVDVGSENVE